MRRIDLGAARGDLNLNVFSILRVTKFLNN
jgi:hypothetical protein